MKPAKGVRGCIIDSFDGNYYFRVYNGTDFVDYDLAHSDLCVTITDEDAFFYRGDNIDRLDHAPATLGYKE